jgi:hypothetical protein
MRPPRIAWALLTASLVSCGTSLPPVSDGDIIFQTSRSAQSEAIQRATASPYSHMGLILRRDGHPYVLEAAATVHYTPLGDWTQRGVGRHFVVKRLKNAHECLTPTRLAALRAAADRLVGRPYDSAFGWSDDRLYCSELVWKLYDRAVGVQLGRLQHLRDFNLTDPVVAAKMMERYGSAVPLDEQVISPSEIFSSPSLETVAGE